MFSTFPAQVFNQTWVAMQRSAAWKLLTDEADAGNRNQDQSVEAGLSSDNVLIAAWISATLWRKVSWDRRNQIMRL